MPRGPHRIDPLRIGRRSNARVRMRVPIVLVLATGRQTVILEDISRTGARVGVSETLRTGDGGFLRCNGVEPFCTVVWSRGGQCGLQFDAVLSEQQLLEMRWYGDNHTEEAKAERNRDLREWLTGNARLL